VFVAAPAHEAEGGLTTYEAEGGLTTYEAEAEVGLSTPSSYEAWTA
jgi:hypothetical protein